MTDSYRPGPKLKYFPGEVMLRMADVVVINKDDSAEAAGIRPVGRNNEIPAVFGKKYNLFQVGLPQYFSQLILYIIKKGVNHGF